MSDETILVEVEPGPALDVDVEAITIPAGVVAGEVVQAVLAAFAGTWGERRAAHAAWRRRAPRALLRHSTLHAVVGPVAVAQLRGVPYSRCGSGRVTRWEWQDADCYLAGVKVEAPELLTAAGV